MHAGFADSQKFVFLSKAALTTKSLRQYVVLHASKTYEALAAALKIDEKTKQMFGFTEKDVLRIGSLDICKGIAAEFLVKSFERGDHSVEA